VFGTRREFFDHSSLFDWFLASSISFNSSFITAFGLHLPMDGVQSGRSHFDIGRTYVTGMPKICRCSNHRSVDAYSTHVAFALLGTLVYTAREPLKQDIARHVSWSVSCRHDCTVLFGSLLVDRNSNSAKRKFWNKLFLCSVLDLTEICLDWLEDFSYHRRHKTAFNRLSVRWEGTQQISRVDMKTEEKWWQKVKRQQNSNQHQKLRQTKRYWRRRA